MSENVTIQKKSKSQINKAVFFTSALLIFLLVAFAAVFPDVADKNFKLLQQQIFTNASWFYILAVALILLSVSFLGLSRYGDIKLGPDHAQPDFSYHSWFAMLFSAGMGIGLMFFGVAEPVMHYLSPPVGTPETVAAAKEAMRLTFFHWGLHAWAIYAIVALILAFFSYRHGLPLTLRSALYPIIGERIYGPVGHAVDIFAVIGTVFGVATSLGYGVLQVNAGLNHLFGVPINETVQVILIVVITGLATISVVSGLDKGTVIAAHQRVERQFAKVFHFHRHFGKMAIAAAAGRHPFAGGIQQNMLMHQSNAHFVNRQWAKHSHYVTAANANRQRGGMAKN